MNIIKIKKNNIPKYQQIINGILNAINNGTLKKHDKIPSLNKVMKEFSLSQDTVLNAYNHLKSKGIISSAVGKGYYVASDQTFDHHKVFVLFDNFTLYKEDLYNAINSAFSDEGTVDIYFHHNNPKVYRKLISEAVGNYTSYIIMPLEDETLEPFLIETLPPKNVYLLDQGSATLKRKFPFVVQDFENDIFNSLSSNRKSIQKYKSIRLINYSSKPHILQISNGLKKFADKNDFSFDNLSDTSKIKILKGDLFVVIKDTDLVELLQKSKEEKFKLGKDFGVISYNETVLKKVVVSGISTISTDFQLMGKIIAEMVKSKSRKRIYNPARLIIRNSI
jgi:DNA-binding transcriptional regulator YhcF (GntR family)